MQQTNLNEQETLCEPSSPLPQAAFSCSNSHGCTGSPMSVPGSTASMLWSELEGLHCVSIENGRRYRRILCIRGLEMTRLLTALPVL